MAPFDDTRNLTSDQTRNCHRRASSRNPETVTGCRRRSNMTSCDGDRPDVASPTGSRNDRSCDVMSTTRGIEHTSVKIAYNTLGVYGVGNNVIVLTFEGQHMQIVICRRPELMEMYRLSTVTCW